MKICKTLIASACLALVFTAACQSMNTETPGTAAIEAPTASLTDTSDYPDNDYAVSLEPTPDPDWEWDYEVLTPTPSPEPKDPIKNPIRELIHVDPDDETNIGWAAYFNFYSLATDEGYHFAGKELHATYKKILIDNEQYFEVTQISGHWGSTYITSSSLPICHNIDDPELSKEILYSAKEGPIALSQFFRYYVNDELVLCQLRSHHAIGSLGKDTGVIEYALIPDNVYPLDQIDTIRIEAFDIGSPVN